MNERERAYRALLRVELDRARADFAIERESAGESDRGFIATVVRGVLRWRTRLDFLIERLARRKIGSIDPEVVVLLRSGLYQMMEMEAPAYAVVNEHVEIAARRTPRARGFVNAVLRGATRTSLVSLLPAGEGAEALAIRTGHPEWLLRRWISRFGLDRARRIAEANQEPSYPDVLVDTAKLSLEDAADLLHRKGIAAEPSPFGLPMFRLRGSTAALAEEIERGMFHPMDEGSAIVAELVESGVSVLDAAAAPGGKSIVLRLRGNAVTGLDRSLSRLASMQRIWKRVFGSLPRAVAGDATSLPFRAAFHTVLLDAPCSATGTIRKNPEVRHRITAGELDEHGARQLAMLLSVADLAEREIIYATCSIEPEENRSVVLAFLERRPEFERLDLGPRVPPSLSGALEEGALVLTPEMGLDGYTASGLRRRSSE
ncbi:MAG TPA: transcription antitermination factor NusB [Thermoanaerobaculia bacterium]|nr:transcription antitermination factor NusB [Thermoanaerobaculia bacterium]